MSNYCRISQRRHDGFAQELAWLGVGVAVVVLGAGLLRSRSAVQPRGRRYPDYSDRSGFPRPAHEMRGAAAGQAEGGTMGARGDETGKNPGDEVRPESEQSGELICDRCGGKGTVAGASCEKCGGSGKVTVLVGDA